MSRYVKQIQIRVSVDCWEILAVESYAIAEATKVAHEETLKKHLNSAITNALKEVGLHPGGADTFIYEDTDDVID